MEDRLNIEVIVTNSAGKVTAKSGVYDLSKLDCAILEKELAEAQTRAIQYQINELGK